MISVTWEYKCPNWSWLAAEHGGCLRCGSPGQGSELVPLHCGSAVGLRGKSLKASEENFCGLFLEIWV